LPSGVRAERDRSDPWVAFGSPAPDVDGVTVAGSHAQYRGWSYRLDDDELPATELAPPGGSLTAPMPASVLRVDVEEGSEVAAGEVLAVLEAMKIQVQVTAPTAGAVRAVHVRAGDVVARGQPLIEMEEP
jgi:biotin carboxyl carrier protein